MKKLLFAVCALAAISLLAPSAGFAQPFQNRIGLYTTADAAAACIDAPTPIGVPFDIFFVVINPVAPDGPMSIIDAFEFYLTCQNSGSSMFRLAEVLPPSALNVGVYTDPYNAELKVGFAAPMPVVNGMANVGRWNVMMMGAGPFRFFMSPCPIASVPGMLAINATVESNAVLVGCMPSSGAFDQAVFSVGTCDVTGVESASFGGVKALFR